MKSWSFKGSCTNSRCCKPMQLLLFWFNIAAYLKINCHTHTWTNKTSKIETVAQSVIEWSFFGFDKFILFKSKSIPLQTNIEDHRYPLSTECTLYTLTHSGVICWQIQVMPINRLNVTMVAHPGPHSIPVCFNGKDNNGDARESIDARQSDTHIV